MNKVREALKTLDIADLYMILLISIAVACIITAIYLIVAYHKQGPIHNKKKLSKFLVHSYRVFSEFFVTKRYVNQMRRRYEMLCPEDTRSLMCKAISMCYLVWISSTVALIVLFGLKLTMLSIGLSVLTVGVINHEYLEYKTGNMQRILMKQMSKFLSDTRHSFYKHGMIDEAIEDAADKSGRIMKLNAVKIQGVLDSSDQETSIRRYNETVSNRFLRMFLSVAVYVSEYGDRIINGVSMLLLNIHTLKSDIHIELMNRKDTNNKFSGMIFITLAPVYMLGYIKDWSISTSPNLSNFYNGTLGIIVAIGIFILTVVMYIMINELKENNEIGVKEYFILKHLSYLKPVNKILSNYGEKNRDKLDRQEDLLYRVGEKLTAKQFLLKRLVFAVSLFGLCVIVTNIMHFKNRDMLLTSTKLTLNSEAIIPDKMLVTAGDTVVTYINIYKDRPLEREELQLDIKKKGLFRSELIREVVVDEIMKRISQYRQEYFHWYELLFAIATTVVGYCFPYWMLLYRKKVLVLNMDNEVALFQSIIMLVMYLDTTTVMKVLEQMESFALIFKESLKTCINEYSSGDLDALEKLKMREKYESFCRLVDNLIMADKIGIQKAFDEVAEERKVSQEMRNQDYKIARDKKVVVGSIMSAIPGAVAVAFYWVIPFAVDALSGLQDYDSIMSAFV